MTDIAADSSAATATLPARWEKLGGWLAPLAVAGAAMGMFCASYGAWPDVIVDFGRELYVPWRLTEGDVLYRDLAYFNGPLSPYFNALWFKLLGTSLRTLVFVNLALVGVLLTLLYTLLSQIGSRASAFLACLFFVLVFGFSRVTVIGNYNYICPYSHEMTHGLLLSLGAIYFVRRFLATARLTNVAACGLCGGLVFLTKPEFSLAALPACALGLTLALGAQRASAAGVLAVAGTFGGTLLVAPLTACGLLSLAMPAAEAARGAWGAHRWLFTEEVTALPFYLNSMGIGDVDATTNILVSMTFWYCVVFGLPIALGFLEWRTRAARLLVAAACFLAVTAGLWWNLEKLPPLSMELTRPLPLLLAVALIVLLGMCFRRPAALDFAQLVMPITLLVFALLLLAKIALYARVSSYGFALAMPATLLAIVVLWNWAPPVIEHFAGAGPTVQGATLAVLVVFVAMIMKMQRFDTETVRVGSGADAFWADQRGLEVNRALAEIAARAEPGATLAGAPEAAMLNYLARRVNPTPYFSLMPVEMILFGEEQIVAAFQRRPADFFLLTDESTNDYGSKAFGFGYGEKLHGWIMANYHAVAPSAEAGAGDADGDADDVDAQQLEIRLLRRNNAGPGAGGAADPALDHEKAEP